MKKLSKILFVFSFSINLPAYAVEIEQLSFKKRLNAFIKTSKEYKKQFKLLKSLGLAIKVEDRSTGDIIKFIPGKPLNDLEGEYSHPLSKIDCKLYCLSIKEMETKCYKKTQQQSR